ncbi:nuclear transport factor 2 family protein [Streptomyces olindensis]|uniref:nuclear transport factor 2 family protein n=1 Tax=Streptomyces olindensis TaxID=358823 RepID=UPI003683000F
MGSTETLTVARRYVDAIAAKDFAALDGLFAEDIVWHQPGNNQLSGTHRGAVAVKEVMGRTMAISEETFELAATGAPMVNGAMFALPVHFSAKRQGAELSMDGVDVLRVEGGRIAEVWLFSDVQEDEDSFWNGN